MDTEMSKSLGVDTVTARRGYSDASFLLHRILHQKVRNVENLRGKIRTSVLVTQGTWELKSIVVLSNAQPFERGPPIYNEYVNYISIYLKGM